MCFKDGIDASNVGRIEAADRELYIEWACEDIGRQVGNVGMKVEQYVRHPIDATVGCVVSSSDGRRFAHISVRDAMRNDDWFSTVAVRRASSIRDWKGECIHECRFDDIGRTLVEIMDESHDSEIL